MIIKAYSLSFVNFGLRKEVEGGRMIGFKAQNRGQKLQTVLFVKVKHKRIPRIPLCENRAK